MRDGPRHSIQPHGFASWLKASVLLVLLLVCSEPSHADGWVVVFEDDFSQSSLDTSQWYTRFIYNNGTMDHFNNELQRYRESGNHIIEGGVLNLVASRRPRVGSIPQE